MGFLNLFKRNKIGGVIGDLGLQEFYVSLSDSEQEFMAKALAPEFQLGTDFKPSDLIKGTKTWGNDVSSFLIYMGRASSDKALAIRFYKEAFNHPMDTPTRHLLRQNLAETYYSNGDLELCEQECLRDIAEIDDYINERVMRKAKIYTFKRLAILYEKQGRIAEAIAVSEKALSYGQHDGTKGGYEKRIEKLRRKILQ